MEQQQHKCNKESEIAEIHTIVKRLDTVLMGSNGKDGMFHEFQQDKGSKRTIKYISGLISAFIAVIVSLVMKLIK